jgi:RNA polymerase sigma-70 factor (ECF subfamily)
MSTTVEKLKETTDAQERQRLLLIAARDGNELAFEELMRLHSPDIYRLANGVLASPQQAADLTQEVFISFYKSLGRIRSANAIGSWLHRVTLNNCYDLLKKRRKEVDLEDALAPGCMQQADSWSSAELSQILKQALDLLSTRQRIALVLTCQLGFSSDKAGEDMGCSAGTVRALVYKARKKLKEVFYQGNGNWS